MVLVADIGNTNITLGIYKNDNLIFVSRLATQRHRTSEQYAIELNAVFK
jgi:type III pantothenate kinase